MQFVNIIVLSAELKAGTHSSESLRSNINNRRLIGVFREKIFEIPILIDYDQHFFLPCRRSTVKYSRKCPLLQRRFLNFEELGSVLTLGSIITMTASSLNAERKLFIGDTLIESLTPVYGCMNLQTDIKELSRIEIRLIRREDTSKGRTCA